jgi:hypothetical protein
VRRPHLSNRLLPIFLKILQEEEAKDLAFQQRLADAARSRTRAIYGMDLPERSIRETLFPTFCSWLRVSR